LPDSATPAPSVAVNQFDVVPLESAAYGALRELAQDGYLRDAPENVRKSVRPLTRFEMAVAVSKAVVAIQTDVEAGKTVGTDDLDAIRALVDTFGDELRTIHQQVAELEQQQKATAAQTQANTDVLSHAKLGFQFFNRPGTITQNVSVTNGPLAAHGVGAHQQLPGGQGGSPIGGSTFGNLTAGAGPAAPMTNITTGTYSHFTDEQLTRLILSGNFDTRFSYLLRLEDIAYPEGANFISATKPAYCTAAAPVGGCGQQDFPTFEPIKLSIGYVAYTAPGGFYARICRINMEASVYSGTAWSFGGSQINGVQVGYGNSRVNAWIAGAAGASAQTNADLSTCPLDLPNCANGNTSAIIAKADYWFPSIKLAVGATYDSWNGEALSVWNPSAGLCTTGGGTTIVVRSLGAPNGCAAYVSAPQLQPNGKLAVSPVTGAYQTITTAITEPSFYVSEFFGNRSLPQFRLSAEYLLREGNNPLTNARWNGNKSFMADAAFASKGNLVPGPLYAGGRANSNVAELAYFNSGLNSIDVDGGPGTVPPWQQFYPNVQGMQAETIQIGHWFSSNFRVGLTAMHFQLAPGVTIPVGSASCPACSITSLNSNAAYFETYLLF
jgi:hypothetical protein